MKRFKSARQLQRVVSIHDPISNLFHIPRHDIPSNHHRELQAAALDTWRDVARLQAACSQQISYFLGLVTLH